MAPAGGGTLHGGKKNRQKASVHGNTHHRRHRRRRPGPFEAQVKIPRPPHIRLRAGDRELPGFSRVLHAHEGHGQQRHHTL